MKWFEKKWFVNLKIRTRLTICFLFVALIGAAIGVAGILFVLPQNVHHSQTFVIVIGAASLLVILIALLLSGINAFLILDPTKKNTLVIEQYSTGQL